MHVKCNMDTKRACLLEYIWMDGKGSIRSKIRVSKLDDITSPPHWNFDGSSTWQATSDGVTEVELVPMCVYSVPSVFGYPTDSRLVICDAVPYSYCDNGATTHMENALKVFKTYAKLKPTFGLEQEYVICDGDREPSTLLKRNEAHYCGTQLNSKERRIVETHLKACMEIGIQIAGVNAEVAPSQWEFQIGPCVGIRAADHLVLARFLLERIAELNNATISYAPKMSPDENGSGCHINFSTTETMDCSGGKGLERINQHIDQLSKTHTQLLTYYGEGNEARLTGTHETSSMHVFTSGVGTRNTSIRIPTKTFKEGGGYIEDRRPAANINPYLATSMFLRSCMGETL